RLGGGRKTDQAAEILVVQRLRYQIGVDQQSCSTLVHVESAGKVAVADLAAELIERPQRGAVLEPAVQPIRRRPWKRDRNDRIELRQIASLQHQQAVDAVESGRDDGAIEVGAGVARARLDVESIRLVTILEREQRFGVAFDRENTFAQTSGPGEMHWRGAAR